MKKDVVIFGAGEIAEVAKFYLATDTPFQVRGFTVDGEYIKTGILCGLPIIPFEEVVLRYPPGVCDMFVALGYSGVNALRKGKYSQAKALGYSLVSYVSSRAHILNDGQIGDNCFILEGNTIQPHARIGNNVFLWSGNHVGHHALIQDHCFISSQVVISGGAVIGESCFIGVNASIRDHIHVGEKCVIGAGALILNDTAPEGVYAGLPAPRSRVSSLRLKRI